MTDRQAELIERVETSTTRFISFKIARAHMRLARQGSRILREVADISRIEWWVVSSLNNAGPARLSDIAVACELDKGQLSRAIRSLMKRDLVSARSTETDLRNQYLQLTDAGHDLFSQTLPHMLKRQEYLLRQLSKAECEVFFKVLGKITEAANHDDFK